MAKEIGCEWVVPVLEDLCKFLEEAEKPEVAREIQVILDRYSETLQMPDKDYRDPEYRGVGSEAHRVVSLQYHRQRRSGSY